jgi:hypothetical protein
LSNTISAFGGNCRVYILIDDVLQSDFDTNPQKSFYKLNSIFSVSSSISVEDGGSASIRVNDKDMKFRKYFPFKYLNTRTFGDERLSTNNTEQAEKDLKRQSLPVALQNSQEIEVYRKFLSEYGEKQPALKALSILADGKARYGDEPNKYGGVLVPLFTPQNLVWIDYMGRDGKWYRKFSGIITTVSLEERPEATPLIILNCKTYDRLLEYSYRVTGLKNIGSNPPTEVTSIKDQEPTIATNFIYGGKTFSEIIVDVFRTANRFFIRDRIDGKDYRYFKVKDIFYFGKELEEPKFITEPKENIIETERGKEEIPPHIEKKLVGNWGYSPITGTYYSEDGKYIWNDRGLTEEQVENFFGGDQTFNLSDEEFESKAMKEVGELGYEIDDPKFKIKSYDFNEKLSLDDFYPGSEVIKDGKKVNTEEKGWIEVIMSKDFFGDKKPFQNLIRTSLQLFNVDKMTPKDIINELRKIVLAYIYFDGDGTVKIERPYFDIDFSVLNDQGQFTDKVPYDFDRRYIITKKDRSYMGSTFVENEQPIVTRVSLQTNADFFSPSDIIAKKLQGRAESSFKTISKYGERIIDMGPVVSQGFNLSSFSEDISNSFCYAQKLLLTSDSKQFNITLDQRPDLQLNRPLMFLDHGLITLIHTLSESYDFATGKHTTTVRGKYTRYVGEQLVNPWRFLIKRGDDANQPELDYVLEPWKDVEPVDLSRRNNIYGIDDEHLFGLGFRNGTVTYQKVRESIQRSINRINPSFTIDEEKVTCLVLRHDRQSNMGYDKYNVDRIFFIWKEDGIEYVEEFKGSGGDPHTQGRWNNSNYTTFAMLEPGIYKYTTPENDKYVGNNKKFLTFACNNFNFRRIKRLENGTFEIPSEIISSRSIGNIKTIAGIDQQLISFLSEASVSFFNKWKEDQTEYTNICYDSLGIIIGEGNQFLEFIHRNQTSIDVIVENFSSNQAINPIDLTDYNLTKVQEIFLIDVSVSNSNYIRSRNNRPGRFKKSPSLQDIQSNININGFRGLYQVTQKMAGIEDINEWTQFLNSFTKQDEWFERYYRPYIRNIFTDQSILVNGISLPDRINLILNNLIEKRESSNEIRINIGDSNTSYPKNFRQYPEVHNKISFIVWLIHYGFQQAYIKNGSNKTIDQLYSNHLTDVLSEIISYYYMNEWDSNTLLIRVGDEKRSSSNKGNVLLKDMGYFLSILNITEF